MVNRYHWRGGWRSGALLIAAVMGAPLLSATPAAAVHGAVPGDFNGDGYRDAVLPAPGANVAGKAGAGAVVVLYGSKSGLSTSRRATITQNTAGVPGAAETDDGFGAATATADLNRDGYADLVVSTPYEDTPRGRDAGMVTVLWGGKKGLTSGTDLPATTAGSYYGLDVAALSSGPGERTEVLVAGYEGAMSFTGPFSSKGTYGRALENRETASVGSVALGDFNRGGFPEEVVVTVRLSELSGGSVYIDPVIGGEQQKGNGLIAATGDVNGDGYADLVVGDPDEPDKTGADGALGGRVLLWYGSAHGIARDAKPVQLTQDTPGVPGASEKYDEFGGALTVADLNRDGLADIVVGAPLEDTGRRNAGQVTVIPGRRTGALGGGAYAFTQNTANIPDADESEDAFGSTVAVGDINKDGKPELLISAAEENFSTGAVWVLPGGTGGPTAKGSRMITAASVGFPQKENTHLGGYGLLGVI
ncbi:MULTISPECIES: FG-GAP-like repeat-containing protein [Streptomyces]|uniref:FG-GAP-like repeat-containing protein n=1 Tax=Streptomyces TaxID=1883 RepID=UPI00167239BA|nr:MULTISPECIES: FG-GAP-like repeat-containing protein [Streptomyces]MBK3520511.1 FG-GAP repeat protein [Streptomyces sp. MBT70]